VNLGLLVTSLVRAPGHNALLIHLLISVICILFACLLGCPTVFLFSALIFPYLPTSCLSWHLYDHPAYMYYILSCFFFFLFLPHLILAVADWTSTILLHTWCGLSANLECRSETCSTRLAGNAGHKKIAKNLPSAHHHTTLSGHIFATEACIDNRKKLVKQPYLLHMSPQCGELWPTNGWDLLASLGHPS